MMLTVITLVSVLPSVLGVTEMIPALSQRVIDLTLPPSPSSSAAITIHTNTQSQHPSQPGDKGNIFFTSSYSGHLNTWSLNLTQDRIHESGSQKTLCFDPEKSKLVENKVAVTVVAFSNIAKDVNINIEAKQDTQFMISENSSVQVSVTPHSPQVFQFQPGPQYNTHDDESYLVTIDTVQNEEKCMYVAINTPGCPWHDSLRTVKNSKLWSRMLKTGFFPIRSKQFPNSFTITLVPLYNSSECHSKDVEFSEDDLKIVRIMIQRTETSYLNPVILSVFLITLSSVLFFIIWGGCWKAQLHNNERRIEKRKEYDKEFREACVRQNSSAGGQTQEEELGSNPPLIELKTAADTRVTPKNALRHDICRLLEEGDRIKGKSRFAINRLLTDKLMLKDMSVVIRDNTWHRRQRSKAFWYLVPLLSLFYLIPSCQMVFAEQQRARSTGNLEQCFLNYGCSRPWWIFDDFNHVISNIGYIMYGLVFLVLVRLKSFFLPEENRTETDHMGRIGLPQQHSLFYTMGICMVMQGVFSAIFHVCPSNISLQFDTTMMYIMMILVFIKIYQFRHPDIATNSYHSMYAFAAVLIMEATSLYVVSTPGKIIFYLLFCILYFGAILHIAIDCYYYGALKTSLLQNLPIFAKHSIHNFKHCLYPKRFGLSVLFVILNLFLMVLTVFRSFEKEAKSLSTPILIICALNVGTFLCYYMVRKIIEIFKNPEGPDGRLRWAMRFFTFIFFLLAIILGAIAMLFYTKRHQSRNSTPPESRDKNELCNVLDFFDNHDMWHFFSATALFLSFIFLLTIDDDLLLTEREKIEVF